MAYADVQNILEGLKIGNQRKQFAQSQALAQSNFTLAKAVHDLAMTKAQHELSQSNLDRAVQGQPTEGAQVTPGYVTPENVMTSGTTPQSAGTAPTQSISLPNINGGMLPPQTIQSPQAYADQQAQLTATQNAPAYQQATNLKKMEEDAAMERALMQERAQNFRSAQENATHLHGQRLSAGIFTPEEAATVGGADSNGTDLGVYQDVDRKLQNGMLSEDDLKDLKPAMKQVIKLRSMSSGSGILNKDQSKYLEDLGAAAQTIPRMLEFLQLQPDSTGGFGAGVNSLKNKVGSVVGGDDPTDQQLRNAEKEIKSHQASLTRTMGGINRLAVPEIRYQEGNSLIDQGTPRTTNALRVGQFINDLHTSIQQKLGNLSPNQVAHIEQTFGLDKWLGVAPGLMSGQIPEIRRNPVTGKLVTKDPKTGAPVPIE